MRIILEVTKKSICKSVYLEEKKIGGRYRCCKEEDWDRAAKGGLAGAEEWSTLCQQHDQPPHQVREGLHHMLQPEELKTLPGPKLHTHTYWPLFTETHCEALSEKVLGQERHFVLVLPCTLGNQEEHWALSLHFLIEGPAPLEWSCSAQRHFQHSFSTVIPDDRNDFLSFNCLFFLKANFCLPTSGCWTTFI